MLHGLLHFGLTLAQLRAELLERSLLLLERVDAGLRLECLGRQLLHLPPVLLKVPFRLHQLFGSLLRARRRVDQRLHALIHLAERLGLLLHRFHALGHGVELAGGGRGLLLDLFQRLAHLRQLGTVHGNLGEHGAQRAPLLLRRRDEGLEVVGLLLRLATDQSLQSFQHGASLDVGGAGVVGAVRLVGPASAFQSGAKPKEYLSRPLKINH